jgi:hypothetical protein
MPHSPTNFRSIVIRHYYIEKEQVKPVKEPGNKPVNVQYRNQEQLLKSRNKPQPTTTRQSA